MIGGVVSHGRTSRDSSNLASHLLNDNPEVEIRNSAASTLREAMSDMEIARDGSRAEAAYLHMYISPSRDMSRDELVKAVDIALKHFGAEDHAVALVFHEKDRANGKGNSHVHAVASRFGPDGHVLPSGFNKIKMETAMRLAEYELGEAPTLGRHTASAIKWMKANGRPEVAAWLEKAHGQNPEKPRSIITPDARQGLERKGVVMATVRQTVTAAWERSDNGKSFAAALAESGLKITKGEKDGVFLVHQGDTQIGALDRIIKQKRGLVAAKMEGYENVSNTQEANTHGCTQSDMERSQPEPQEHRKVAAIADAPGRARGERGRSNSGATGNARPDPSRPASPNDADRGHGSKARRFDQVQAVRQIEAHQSGWDRLRELRNDFVAFLRNFVSNEKSEPEFSPRDREIAAIFSKACHYSAENMEKLEKLDPDLSAFREQYGERCRGMTQDQILQNLESWRERGAELTSNFDEDDKAYQPSSMRI